MATEIRDVSLQRISKTLIRIESALEILALDAAIKMFEREQETGAKTVHNCGPLEYDAVSELQNLVIALIEYNNKSEKS